MSAKRVVAAVVLLSFGVGIGVGVATLLGDDDDEARPRDDLPVETTTTIEAPDPERNPEAAELFAVVSAFTDLTLHARYEVEVAGRDEASVIEIWQKDGKVRQDATVGGDDQAGKLTLLDLPDRVVLCQQPPGGAYSCGLVSDQQATSFEQLRTSLLTQLEEQEVTVRDESEGGRDLRCFTIAVTEGSELCVTADGVLARITAPQGSFELLSYETDVDDSVFTPPAEPGTATPS